MAFPPHQAGPHLHTHGPRETEGPLFFASELPGTQVPAVAVQRFQMLKGHCRPLPLTLTWALPTSVRLGLPSPHTSPSSLTTRKAALGSGLAV